MFNWWYNYFIWLRIERFKGVFGVYGFYGVID